MKRNIVRSCVVCMLVLFMVFGQVIVGFAETDSEIANKKMAHNIYTSPDTSKTSGKYNTFSIDFYGVQTPNYTYWALANFSMDITIQTKLKYSGITGGGAYSGLQHTRQDTKVAILSFWEWNYRKDGQDTKLRAERIFPEGTSNFGGEGEGTNCIKEYKWNGESWYRMVLHCWEDLERKSTFAGQWVCDLSTGEWTLISYFDTKMIKSHFQGNMGLFQENYISGLNNWTKEREFRVKNLYVNDAKDGEWKSLTGSTLSFGHGQDNKMGVASFGIGEDADGQYFWGKAGGLAEGQGEGNYVAAQQAYLNSLTAEQKSKYYKIEQPDLPTFGDPSIAAVNLTEKDGKWTASWDMGKTSTPQGVYKVEVTDKSGKTIFTKEASRPEETSLVLDGVDTDAFNCKVTVTDIFGKSVVLEKATENYGKADPTPTPTPTPTPAPEETTPVTTTPVETEPATEEPNESGNTGLVVGITVAAVVVIGGGAVALVVVNKKKKEK